MRYFPIFMELDNDSSILIYGGGEDAARKARLLTKTSVTINLIAVDLNNELTGLVKSGRANWIATSFAAEQLDISPRAIVGASDETTNTLVSLEARVRNIPVNIIDRADLSTFIVPAIVDRDPLVIAIGTEGAGPVLAQGLRASIEAMLPPTIGGLLNRAAALRGSVSNIIPAGAERRTFWKKFFFGAPRNAYLNADDVKYAQSVNALLSSTDNSPETGHIALLDVCSDPELLTLKAHRLLQEADVIIHDTTVPSAVLEYARRDAVRHETNATVWSSGLADHQHTAEDLLEQAATGTRVVRLYDASLSALDSELAALRNLNTTSIAIDHIRSSSDETIWGPLVGGTSADGSTSWRLAS